MTNLGLKLVQMLVPASKYDTKCPNQMLAQRLTIHNTANNASALAEISYMIGNSSETSFHWAVDDLQAIQGIPHDRNAWHCGDGVGQGNMSSIGIEICHSLDPQNPRYAQSEENGAKLAALILHQMGWGVDRMFKHQDWSGKYCPHRILDNNGWVDFKAKVQNYLNQLNQPQNDTETITELGGLNMYCTFTVLNSKNFVEKGVYFYNPNTNTYRHLKHMDEWNILKQIFKDNYGRELPHYVWDDKTAPWQKRLFGATGATEEKR